MDEFVILYKPRGIDTWHIGSASYPTLADARAALERWGQSEQAQTMPYVTYEFSFITLRELVGCRDGEYETGLIIDFSGLQHHGL